VSYDKNPYVWDSSAGNIMSSVSQVHLTDTNGQALDVAHDAPNPKQQKAPSLAQIPHDAPNLQWSPITYDLSVPFPNNLPNTFVAPNISDTMTYHRLTKHSNDTALLIEITPTNHSVLLKVYLAHDTLSTEDDSDWQMVLPNQDGLYMEAVHNDTLTAGNYVLAVKQCKLTHMLIVILIMQTCTHT
jgi:hypothetical protein